MQSPPLAPHAQSVDLAHLFRMTLGDSRLEREVLALFDRQIEMLMARMSQATPARIAAMAHTMLGSARGIGAWTVAEAAEAVERAVADKADLARPLAVLHDAAQDAQRAIAEKLAQP
ncbi:MAG: Hpt domain-containing protein [Proteobacteria bacterium]|nr:Hpt domain-containing protein [Pseudomonadota bacterium]